MANALDDNGIETPAFKLRNYLKIRYIIAVLLVFFAAFVIYYHFGVKGKTNTDAASLFGTFGDFIGGTFNPLLTFVSVFLLIGTISIQHKELALTRKELTLTRAESEKTATALNTQAIENTFFNILKLHNDISLNLNSVIGFLYKNTRDKTEYKGRDVFISILDEVKKERQYGVNENKPNVIYKNYIKIQKYHNHILGQYFINLYQALKLIDSYNDQILSPEDKKKYSSILRAQLSTKELAVLFLNCLDGVCDNGQFKNLLIKYSILEHLPIVQIDNNTFELANDIHVSGEMIQQYQHVKTIEIETKEAIYGGAFGKNNAIPADYIAPPF